MKKVSVGKGGLREIGELNSWSIVLQNQFSFVFIMI